MGVGVVDNNKDSSIVDLVAASHDIRSDCVSWTYNLTHERPTRGALTYQKLAPGQNFFIPFIFAKAGAVRLIIEANILSDAVMELTILDARREIWGTQSSTRTAGPYVVDLEAPGAYILRVANSKSSREPLSVLLNVTACGDSAVNSWLIHYTMREIMEVTCKFVQPNRIRRGVAKTTSKYVMAPMGIAVYGIKRNEEQYSTYKLTTNAVKGVVDISPDILAISCEENGVRSGRIFSVQLNAVVAAELIDGGTEYYWVQNVIRFGKFEVLLDKLKINIIEGPEFNGFEIINNIRDMTDVTSTLDEFKVKGRGGIIVGGMASEPFYIYYGGTIPFGRVELETWVRAKKGKIIVKFYANRRKYDEVTIKPRVPATSAHIVVAPRTTPIGLPLDLELAFGGYSGLFPSAILKRGRIRLELYVRENDKWVPPPSAWSIGFITYERSYARVVPQGVGSVIVEPGEPSLLQQLWP